ncbi:MAG TPA: SAM-dependent methyltransferase, partial [Actinomycetota bacterium]|nr:SAM-dependent methyltransferase [Actinomycetota bacterium]
AEAGLPAPECPWYFPTPGQYATLLEAGGFRVARMEHFPRPTPLAGGPGGLADWFTMFGGQLTAAVPPARLPDVVARAEELAAPRLRRGDRWVADYWRLRFVAVAGAEAARPAKLHRQMAGDRDR